MIWTHTREDDLFVYDFVYVVQFKKAEERWGKLWQMKTSVRESVKDWLVASDISPHISERCANACSELIENCIKYTNNETVAVVSIYIDNRVITVETRNTTTPDHKVVLRESIDILNATSDLQQLFVEKLHHPVDGKSRLGLIKIVMETKGTLQLIPEQEENVHVKLRMKAA